MPKQYWIILHSQFAHLLFPIVFRCSKRVSRIMLKYTMQLVWVSRWSTCNTTVRVYNVINELPLHRWDEEYAMHCFFKLILMLFTLKHSCLFIEYYVRCHDVVMSWLAVGYSKLCLASKKQSASVSCECYWCNSKLAALVLFRFFQDKRCGYSVPLAACWHTIRWEVSSHYVSR